MTNIDALADERDSLRLEEREIIDQIRETRAKLAKMRTELQSLRKNRDELNETVRALKKDRDELRTAAKLGITTLKGLRKVSGRTFEGVRAEHEMAQLEWKIQTAPMGKEEEKQFMAKVKMLETKVGSYKRIQRLSQEVDRERNEADELHGRVQQLAETSQKHHEEILSLGEKFHELRQKLDDQEKRLGEVRGRAREATQKYFSIVTMTREADRIAQAERQKAHKEGLKESAKKKLSKGEKVSLHELGALLEEEGTEK